MAIIDSNPIPKGNDPVTGSCTGSITAAVVKRIETTGKRFTIRDTSQSGLILRIGATGTRSWFLDYRTKTGVRQSYRIGSTATHSVKEARAEARSLLAKDDPAGEKRQVKKSKVQAASRSLRAYLDGKYRQDVLVHRKSGEGTRKRIMSAFKPLLDKDMATLTVVYLEKHVAARRRMGIKPQSLNRERTALLALLNQAVRHRILESNPLAGPAGWVRLEVTDDKRVRWLGQHDHLEDFRDTDGTKTGERERFLLAIEKQPEYVLVMVKLALGTGLRRGELFGLTWGNVDLQEARLTVTAATAKTSKTRHVPLNTAMVRLLKEWRSNLRSIDGKRLVFPSPQTGEKLTHIKRSWATLVKDAKLDDFRLHDCRHDFASRLVQAGVDLYQVRDLLGHSSIQLTERYAHLAPHKAREAVEVLVNV